MDRRPSKGPLHASRAATHGAAGRAYDDDDDLGVPEPARADSDTLPSPGMHDRDPLERQPLVSLASRADAADEDEEAVAGLARGASDDEVEDPLGGSLLFARLLPLLGVRASSAGVPAAFWWCLELLLVMAVYMTVGPALILVNKHIMKDLGFPYPICVSTMGQLSSWAFCVLCFRVLKTHSLQMCEQVTWRFYVANMGVVGAASAGALAFGQGVYLYMSVSFIQILKSLGPVITSCFLVAFGIETPTRFVWCCVLMISAGAALASYGELHFSALGVGMMLTASCCEGLRLVLTQKVVQNLKFPALEGLYYNAPITAAWMLLAALFLELPAMLHAERRGGGVGEAEGPGGALANATAAPGGGPPPLAPSAVVYAHRGEFALACTLGVLVNVSSMLMIKYTSSVSLKLLATARNAGLVLYAVLVTGESTTRTQVLGYAIACCFFVLYVYAKSQQHMPGGLSRVNSTA